jgi:hypothetical protein
MSVYVDSAEWPFGRMMMCHMMADSLGELNSMADAIGVQRKWIQDKRPPVHFDICKTKRARAVKLGAIEITRQQCSDFVNKSRNPKP